MSYTRRHFLGAATLGALALAARPGAAAEWLRTPAQTEGPFYPDRLPLDTDNDLVIINDSAASALGPITHLMGSIRDMHGEPLNNAVVEIWQVDHNGVYLHSASGNRARRDRHFQGFGRFLTGTSGEYYFRTIKPVPYPGRAPHIHIAVKVRGHETFTTQCYVKGEPLNERDSVLNGIADPRARAVVVVPFMPVSAAHANELVARFDIVLGFTPAA